MSEWVKTGFEIYTLKQPTGAGMAVRTAEIRMKDGVFESCGFKTAGLVYTLDDWAFLFLVANKILNLSGRQVLGELLKGVAKNMEIEVSKASKDYPTGTGKGIVPCDRVFEIIQKHLGVKHETITSCPEQLPVL